MRKAWTIHTCTINMDNYLFVLVINNFVTMVYSVHKYTVVNAKQCHPLLDALQLQGNCTFSERTWAWKLLWHRGELSFVSQNVALQHVFIASPYWQCSKNFCIIFGARNDCAPTPEKVYYRRNVQKYKPNALFQTHKSDNLHAKYRPHLYMTYK